MPCLAHRRGPERGLRLHRQGQPGGGDLQRHGRARPRRSRRARLQAGDGRQGGAVQALRRHRLRSTSRSIPRTSTSSSTACAISAPTFGGINLEDIKAPECFIIEQRLRELLDIPVFHDDQHGTAIIAAAGLINALRPHRPRAQGHGMVVNGAGAASIACIELIKTMGLPHDNAILCDTKGVIYQGRTKGMNQWKSAPRRRHQGAHAGRGDEGRRRVLRPLGQGRGRRRRWSTAWPTSRSSSPWPIPIRRSRRKRCGRCARTPSSPPAAPTIPTRSTTSWAFPTSSAARSTCAPRPSTTR